MKEVACDVGLSKLRCTCGKKVEGIKALENFFTRIIALCRAGEEVRIKGFGRFSAKVLKGRKLKSSMLSDEQFDFADVLVLRFHQSGGAKQILNRNRNKPE